MVFGLDGFTLFHIVLSLVGLAAGFTVLGGVLSGADLKVATHLFFLTTLATSLTGFLFPFTKLLPSHIVGAVSLAVLAVAAYAYYAGPRSNGRRRLFAIAATLALYLNTLVLVVQTFVKNPALAAVAPTQAEPPFLATQGLVLMAFLALGYCAQARMRAA